MSSIFAETIAKAIHEYRTMLRKHLPQSERMVRLSQLNLKDPAIYDSEVSLFHTAHRIVDDIEQNVKNAEQGYYSYSGIIQFAKYLKQYLNKYELENNQVIHRTQKASRAIVQAIQLITLPSNRLSESIATKLLKCNEMIATFGSNEQFELHMGNLEKYKTVNEEFYNPIIAQFKQVVAKAQELEEQLVA